MKAVLLAVLLTGCGVYSSKIKPREGKPGTSCSTTQDSVGVYVKCTDGTESFIPFPEDGESIVGPKGDTGEAGSSCSVNDSGLLTCTDGSSFQVENGTDGVSCDLVEKNVTCNAHHTKKFKQYLKCGEKEVYIRNVIVRGGC